MATSQRLLAAAILALLIAAIATAVVKGPEKEPVTIGPSPTPSPTETFTFPGPLPTKTETPILPTEGETPTVSPTEGELPRTGAGAVAWPAGLTLALAIAGGAAIGRAARRDP